MRILTLTTLYPNAAQPAHGVFVENRLHAFAERSGAEFRIVAPVPWFPVSAPIAGRYAAYARAPTRETRRGFKVTHPRYAIPPKVGMTYAVHALERCFLKAAREIIDEGWDFDLIDAHYLYPDGVAAVRVARALGKPVIVTARGTDVSLMPNFPRQRAMILEAVKNADAIVAVAGALKDELVRLGAPPEKIAVLRNGVDLEMFRPLDRNALRRAMGLEGDVVASVGHLTERKGHHLVIDAVADMPETTLLIAGAGEEKAALEKRAADRGLTGRVRFLGPVAHDQLAEIYNAADALALASSREGWPNVLLEAMACGAPAVASPVWGSGEVIRAPAAGALARERTAPAMRDALARVLADKPARAATRRYAEQFSWDETSDALGRLFGEVVASARAADAIAFRPLTLKPGPPRLIVTVDTEEAFDWSQFKDVRPVVCPPTGIQRFQQAAEALGVAPVYLLTFPVIADADCAAFFRGIAQSGQAALGLHLHQWTTPPLDGFDGEYYSYQCNLPRDVHAKKLRALADAFDAAFGFKARAHRAGRYGVDRETYARLAEIGVDLDFSPSPCFDFSAAGGPNFSGDSNRPFAVVVPSARPILTTPVCGGLAIRGGRMYLARRDPGPGLFEGRKHGGIRVTAPQRLTCEGSNLDDVKALTRRLAADGTPVLTFSFHSTTMTAGANPYAKTPADVERALDFCNSYFDFFKNELGGDFLTLDSLAALYASAEN